MSKGINIEVLAEKITNKEAPKKAKLYMLIAYMLPARSGILYVDNVEYRLEENGNYLLKLVNELIRKHNDRFGKKIDICKEALFGDDNDVKKCQNKLFLMAIAADKTNIYPYLSLKDNLQEAETVAIENEEFGKKELILKAIEVSPYESMPYSTLALLLEKPTDTILLNNGEKQNQNQLFLKSVQFDRASVFRQFREKYKSSDRKILLPDGRKLTKQEILKTISKNGNDALAYAALALAVQVWEDVKVGKENMSQKELIAKSIELINNSETKHGFPFFVAALILEYGSEMKVGNSKYGHVELFGQALSYSSEEIDYNLLPGLVLSPEIRILVRNSECTPKDLLERVIAKDPMNADALVGLGLRLESEEQQKKFVRATESAPENKKISFCLAFTLDSNNASIEIGKEKFKRHELMAKAV